MAVDRKSDLIAGRYRVVSVLGQGAMGIVYRAEQLDPEGSSVREVALKMIHPAQSSAADLARRFLQEVRITARLRSPHIVMLHDVGQTEEGHLYFSMELVTGPTLKGVIVEEGALPLRRALDIADQLAAALGEAHRLSERVIHRDLKPANVFLERRGGRDWVKVGDFGIAKVLAEQTAALTQTGFSLGTPYYMPPEQWRGEEVDERADLYALGVILYEMLAGQPPYKGSTQTLMYLHLQGKPPALPFTFPGGVLQLIDALLAKRPADRPASADAVRALLAAALESPHVPSGERSTEILASATGTPTVITEAHPPSTTELLTREAEMNPRGRPSPWLYLRMGRLYFAIGSVAALLLFARLDPSPENVASRPPSPTAPADRLQDPASQPIVASRPPAVDDLAEPTNQVAPPTPLLSTPAPPVAAAPTSRIRPAKPKHSQFASVSEMRRAFDEAVRVEEAGTVPEAIQRWKDFLARSPSTDLAEKARWRVTQLSIKAIPTISP